jgi:hypothetical protein
MGLIVGLRVALKLAWELIDVAHPILPGAFWIAPAGRLAKLGVDFATARENKNVPLPFGMANHRVFAGSTDCRPEDDVANAVVRLLRHGRLDAGFLEALHQLRSG